MADQLERCSDTLSLERRIVELLDCASSFDTKKLANTLRQGKGIDPTLADSLPLAINKLGRYHRIAMNLVNAATTKDFSHFQSMTVAAVAPHVINQRALRESILGFDSVVDRLGLSGSRPPMRQRKQTAKHKYDGQVISSSAVRKVHAEIQILLHYEQNEVRYPPRIICASKSACFLCHLFIMLHGRFTVPRTHGRLYIRWTLPDWEQGTDVPSSLLLTLTRFNRHLENNARDVLLHGSQRRPPPNESVLELYDKWSSHSTIKQLQGPGSLRGDIPQCLSAAPSTIALLPGVQRSWRPYGGESFHIEADMVSLSLSIDESWSTEQHNPFHSFCATHVQGVPEVGEMAATDVVHCNALPQGEDVSIGFSGEFPRRLILVGDRSSIILTFGTSDPCRQGWPSDKADKRVTTDT